MGNLVVFPEKTQNRLSYLTPDYSGRILALNIEKIRKFQCRAYVLGPRTPYAVVPPEACMENIHMAVLDGRLLDVTDMAAKGLKTENVQMMKVEETELPEQKLYFVYKKIDDKIGHLVLVVPKDAEQAKDFERQIKETGTIDIDLPKEELEKPTGLTDVTVTPIPDEAVPKLVVLAEGV